jgi:hypothetical protein
LRLIGLAVVLALSLILVPLVEVQGQTSVHRVGVLLGAPMSAVESSVRAFRDGLRELGYVEGQNSLSTCGGARPKRVVSTLPPPTSLQGGLMSS